MRVSTSLHEPFGHQASILHDRHHPAGRTVHVLAHEFDVHFGNRRLTVDLDQPGAFEVDEEQVHDDRVRDHGAFQSAEVESQLTCRGPALRQLPTARYLNTRTPLRSDQIRRADNLAHERCYVELQHHKKRT